MDRGHPVYIAVGNIYWGITIYRVIRGVMRVSGIIASAVFWIFTFISISRNTWFDFYRDAFSDLGGSRANDPWIYNYGLIVASIFVILLSLDMIMISRTKIGVVGGSYISIAGIFLALIGIFPAGTRPHTFVSTWFFIQAFIGFLIYGLGEFRKYPGYLATIIIIFITALSGAIIIRWPSAATIEAYEIILLTVASLIYVIKHRFQ
ncbi:MAG: DUF998 domain-containing protein [Sulfolobales archaeon]|jgi:hypothetical membrane protein